MYTYATTIDRQPLIAVNGSAVRATPDAAGYVTIDRVWQSGDVIAADFPMAVRRVMADARVREDRRRTAIERVPIVYCAEGPDCNGGRALDLVFDESRVLETSRDEAFFGGVPVIATEARRMTQPEAPATPVRLIPYHLWANRRRRDDGLALERRLLARRCRARRRADLLRQSQLSRRWMALSRSRAVRSERRREVGMLPPDHSRRHGHGNRHRPKEHG